MNTSANINYEKSSKVFKISEFPQFLSDYYTKGSKSYFHVIIIPVFVILAAMIAFKLKGTYELFV